MKALGLTVLTIGVFIILVGTISYAAPACCDPSQSQNMVKLPGPAFDMGDRRTPGVATQRSTPGANQPVPVPPQMAYGPLTQAKRPANPAPVQLSSAYRSVGPVSVPAPAGCCGRVNASTVPTVGTAGRGCGADCTSCWSRGSVAGKQFRSSVQSGVPGCCAGRRTNPAPAVQAQLKVGSYAKEKPAFATIRPSLGTPATLTANPGSNRSQASRFSTLW